MVSKTTGCGFESRPACLQYAQRTGRTRPEAVSEASTFPTGTMTTAIDPHSFRPGGERKTNMYSRAKRRRLWTVVLLTTLLLGLALLPSRGAYSQVGRSALAACATAAFSTEEDFITQGPEPADGNPIISDGDLLSPTGLVCARNWDLVHDAFDVDRSARQMMSGSASSNISAGPRRVGMCIGVRTSWRGGTYGSMF